MRFLSIRINIFLFIWFAFTPVFSLAQNDISDAVEIQKKVLTKQPDNIRALKEISFLNLHLANYDEAIGWAEKLRELGYKTHDEEFAILYAHVALGQAYVMKGEKYKAYMNLDSAQIIAEAHSNDSALCSVFNGLGLYAANLETDYYRSIEYFFQGIEAAKRANHEQLHNILLINISGIYYLMNDSVGLTYSLEAYERGHEASNPYLIYAAATNTTYMYFLKGDFEKALQYIKEAEFLMKQNDFYDQTNVFGLYGHILLAQNKLDEALLYFEKAMKERDKANTSSLVYALYGYARAWKAKNDTQRSIGILNKALQLTHIYNNPIHRDKILSELSDYYTSIGDFEKALEWRIKYQIESDSLFNADKDRLLSDLRIKYDSERQENIIKESELSILEKTKQTQLLIALLLSVVMISLFLIIFIRRRNKLYSAIVSQYRVSIRREQHMQKKLQELMDDRYQSSALTEEKGADLFAQLEKLMREQNRYRDNLLTRDKVAEELDSNRTYLSQIINRQTGLTFTQYVNEYRINEAVRQLSKSNNAESFKSIAQSVGFNSMTTFYKAFQQVVGMTPTQYRNKIK